MSNIETNLSDAADVGDLHHFGYVQSLRRTLGPDGSFAIAFSMISITTAIFFLLPSLFATAGAAGVWLWIPCAAGVFVIVLLLAPPPPPPPPSPSAPPPPTPPLA